MKIARSKNRISTDKLNHGVAQKVTICAYLNAVKAILCR